MTTSMYDRNLREDMLRGGSVRGAFLRLVLSVIVVVVTVTVWPNLESLGLFNWLIRGSLIGLVVVIWNLGVEVRAGQATFTPAAALMAYLTLGLGNALAVIVVGLTLGGAIAVGRKWRVYQQQNIAWWDALADQILWPIGQHGVGLLVAHRAYQLLAGETPLRGIGSLQELSTIVTALIVFLIAYDLLLIIDLWARRLSIREALAEDWRAVLGIQLLPLVPVPFAALVLARQGVLTFFIFELILLAIVIVIHRLTITQRSLNTQVSQLQAFSSMARALRTTLQINDLLQTTYFQIANLLSVKNLYIVLNDTPERPEPTWKIKLAVEGGKFAKDAPPDKLDDFITKTLEESTAFLAEPVTVAARKLNLHNPPSYARSWMAVPLVASGRLLGCLVTWLGADEQPDRSLDESALTMFGAVAAQTSVALENALVFQAARAQAMQLERLNEISTKVNASLNPERVMELITEAVLDVAACEKTAVYLIQPGTSGKDLVLAHANGFKTDNVIAMRNVQLPLADAERRKLEKEGRAIVFRNTMAEGVQISPGMVLINDREPFHAYALLPLRAQNEFIGLLAVFYNEPHYFNDTEIELLETFANQAALAIINAQVYQRIDVQLARRADQIMQMHDINRRLSSTLDMETIFDLIIDTAMEGTNADAGVLVLSQDPTVEEDDDGLNMVAWRGFDAEKSNRAPHHVAEELADKVLSSGETMISSMDDPENMDGPRSQLSVPIRVDRRTIGAIALESEMLDAFGDEDVTFVGQLALQASVAIRNGQLYLRAQTVRDRLHAILDSSNDGLLMIDAKSRIVMTNTRMGDFWDFARQDFGQRSPDQFLADPLTALGEGLGYKEGELNGLIKEGQANSKLPPKTDLYEAMHNGRQRFVERTAMAVNDEQGSFIGLLLLFRDLTDQKQLERAREDLTNMMVHDLRAPLQAVMGTMTLINQRRDEVEVIAQASEVSSRAVKKLLTLVNNLLDLSMQEGGELTIKASDASIKSILSEATDDLIPLAQESNAVIKVVADDKLPVVAVDRDMIERVVVNLVDNALKFTPPGALVMVSAQIDKDDPRKMRVMVTDNGPGVPDAFKTQVFDRYSMVPETKGRRRSAGLGLAFCKMAVEAHEGKIWVEDNPDGGSTFIFTVPIKIGAPSNGTKKKTEAAAKAESDTKQAGTEAKPADAAKDDKAQKPDKEKPDKAADGDEKKAEDDAG